ncbi:hypothetical protein L7F22_028532 [Adiantum nelumboides]|nr:hypothetical protein [Adiantum nelumboides]
MLKFGNVTQILKRQLVHDGGPPLAIDAMDDDLEEGEEPYSSSKKGERRALWQDDWSQSFKWLVYDNEKVRLFCSFCLDYPHSKSAYAKHGSRNFKTSNLKSHARTQCHRDARTAKHFGKMALKEGLKKMNTTQEDALLNLFKAAFFIGKNSLPFALYPSLLSLMKETGVKCMTSLYNDDKACTEIIQCLAKSIMDETLAKVRESPWFGVTVDESIDIAIHHHMVVYITYLEKGCVPCTSFYGMIRTHDSSAQERPYPRRPSVKYGGAAPLVSIDAEQLLVTSSGEKEDNPELTMDCCSSGGGKWAKDEVEPACTSNINAIEDSTLSESADAAKVNSEDAEETRTASLGESALIRGDSKSPGVIGRLMGLESLPASASPAPSAHHKTNAPLKSSKLRDKDIEEVQRQFEATRLAKIQRGLSDEELEALLQELNGNICTILSHLPPHLGISSYISSSCKKKLPALADSDFIPSVAARAPSSYLESRSSKVGNGHVISDQRSPHKYQVLMANLRLSGRTEAPKYVQESGRNIKTGRFNRAGGELVIKSLENTFPAGRSSITAACRDGRSNVNTNFKKTSSRNGVKESRKLLSTSVAGKNSNRSSHSEELSSQKLKGYVFGEGSCDAELLTGRRKKVSVEQMMQLNEGSCPRSPLLDNRLLERLDKRPDGDKETCVEAANTSCCISVSSFSESVTNKLDLNYEISDACSFREEVGDTINTGSRVSVISEEDVRSLRRRSTEVAGEIYCNGKELNPLLRLQMSRRAERNPAAAPTAAAGESESLFAEFESMQVGNHEVQQEQLAHSWESVQQVPNCTVAVNIVQQGIETLEKADQSSCICTSDAEMKMACKEDDVDHSHEDLKNFDGQFVRHEARQKLSAGRSEAGADEDGHSHVQKRWPWPNHGLQFSKDELHNMLHHNSSAVHEDDDDRQNKYKILNSTSKINTTAAMLQDVICALNAHNNAAQVDSTSTPTSSNSNSSSRHSHSACHLHSLYIDQGQAETDQNYQPSPVSVLLAPFDDDGDASPARTCHTSSASTIQSEQDYVAAVLAATPASEQTSRLPRPGNDLFVQLEDRVEPARWLDSEVVPPTRSYRRLVFDCVCEALSQADENGRAGVRHQQARALFQEMCRWRQCEAEMVTLDDLVEADLRKPGHKEWLLFKAQTRHLLLILQHSILGLLVEELVCDLVLTSY